MTTIRDPDNSHGMKVNDEGRGLVTSIQEAFDRHENHEHGGVWSYTFEDVNPAGANDKFFYIENTSTTLDYAITDIRAFASTAVGKMSVKLVTGTPSYITGTDVTPLSRNTRFNRAPSISCKHDTDITGLSDTGTVFMMNLRVADTDYKLSTSANIILAPGGAMAFEWEAATGEISAVISVVELEAV